MNKMKRVSETLSQEKSGEEPTVKDLAKKMKLSKDKIMKIMALIPQQPISLQTPIGDEGDTSFEDFIEDKKAESPANRTLRSMFREELLRIIESLNDREKKIVVMRFGIADGIPKTLQELAKIFKVTRERIRQIEAVALKKLRHPKQSGTLRIILDMINTLQKKPTSYSNLESARSIPNPSLVHQPKGGLVTREIFLSRLKKKE
jgi:RNA polymerase primary sigma factor